MANAVIGALRVILGADTAKFTKKMNEAQRHFAQVGAKMQKVGRTLSRSLTLPVTGLSAGVLKVAGDFEASMNRVRAALGATDTEFGALRDAAMKMGKETQFSASQAADAIEILAKNGLSASDILGGALESSLRLAAASGTDLSTSGDIATDVMAAFGKQASDLAGIVDSVTGTLLTSKLTIDDYRLALGQAGGVAGGLGVGINDFNVALAATAPLFSSGSDAGTSFKTFLTRLSPASKDAEKAMEALGIEFFNADGSMKGLSDVAGILQESLKGLSDEAKTAALQDIFGRDAMRTAIGLAEQGADGINELSRAIGTFSAQEQAEARMQGLNGELLKLRSAFEGLLLAVADSGILSAFTEFVEGLTGLINKLAEADPKFVKFGVAIAGVAAIVGPLVITIGLFTAAIGAISAPLLAVGAALGAVATALILFWDEIVRVKDALIALATEAIDFVIGKLNALDEALGGLGSGAVGSAKAMADGVGAEMARMPGAMAPAHVAAAAAKASFHSLWDAVVGHSYIPDMVEGVEQWMKRLARSMPAAAEKATEGTKTKLGGLEDFGSDVGQALNNGFSGAFDSLIDGTFDAMKALNELAKTLAKAAFNKFLGGLFGEGGILGFADGTGYAPGGMALVGERGPEIVNLPRGSQVVPNDQIGGGRPNVIVLDDRNRFLDAMKSPEGEDTFVELGLRTGAIGA